MPHVELSLIDSRRRLSPGAAGQPVPPEAEPQADPPEAARVPRARQPEPPEPGPARGSLDRWAAVVAGAVEPSLVLDTESVIVAASASCAEMLGCGDSASACGRRLQDAVTQLVDFTDPPDKLDSAEAGKIPPLLAISSGRLARGLMRVACAAGAPTRTMDAIATPLWEGKTLVGSLTFFSRV